MGVHVDVDAPKGQDLAKIMEEMREKYERIALKNQQELKAWHESQVGLKVGDCLCHRHPFVCHAVIFWGGCFLSSVNRSAGPGDREHDSPEGSNIVFV